MTGDELRTYALGLPGAWADQPWEGDVVVKVGGPPGRIFLFPGEDAVTLKVDPDEGAELRAAYSGVVGDPPYLSKRHWVRVRLCGTVPDDELTELVAGSYRLVVAGLPRSRRPT